MLRELKEKDIDDVMKIWRDGNFKAHNFISSAYWSERYKKVQDEYLRKADTLVYDEDGNIIHIFIIFPLNIDSLLNFLNSQIRYNFTFSGNELFHKIGDKIFFKMG